MKIVKRLYKEYKTMHKPDRKTFMKDSARIAGSAICLGIALKIIDTGFAALLGSIL